MVQGQVSIRADVEDHQKHMTEEPRWLGWLWIPVLVPLVAWALLMVPLIVAKELWTSRMCFKCRHSKDIHDRECAYYRPDVGGGKWVKGQANYNAEHRCRCRWFLGRP